MGEIDAARFAGIMAAKKEQGERIPRGNAIELGGDQTPGADCQGQAQNQTK